MKLLEPTTKPEPAASEQMLTDDPSVVAVSGQDMDKNDDDDSGDWEQVGPRNKSSITRMVCVEALAVILSCIFIVYLIDNSD